MFMVDTNRKIKRRKLNVLVIVTPRDNYYHFDLCMYKGIDNN